MPLQDLQNVNVANITTGSRTKFLLDGRVVGVGTFVSMDRATGYIPFLPLNNMHVRGHVPVSISVSLSFSGVALSTTDFAEAGYRTSHPSGQSEEDFIKAIVAQAPLVAVIEDSITGNIAQVDGVLLSSESWSYASGSMTSHTATAVATTIRVKSEL